MYGDDEDRFDREVNCQVHLNRLLDRQQTLITQKNHLQWLSDGDRNTNFFHIANAVRKTNSGLTSLLVNGELSQCRNIYSVCKSDYIPFSG
ncbi:hypothetical protein ACS0TY_034251 [Phlomoides rotata]